MVEEGKVEAEMEVGVKAGEATEGEVKEAGEMAEEVEELHIPEVPSHTEELVDRDMLCLQYEDPTTSSYNIKFHGTHIKQHVIHIGDWTIIPRNYSLDSDKLTVQWVVEEQIIRG